MSRHRYTIGPRRSWVSNLGFGLAIALTLAVNLTIFGGIAYVIAHFVAKFW